MVDYLGSGLSLPAVLPLRSAGCCPQAAAPQGITDTPKRLLH